jgi:excisionase family DNA binding protein
MTTAAPPAGLFTVAQVATALGVTPGSIYSWIAENRIPTVRIGSRTIRVRGDVLERLQREGVPARRTA